MTKYLEPSFSTFAVGSDEYRDRWDAIFKKKPAEQPLPEDEETAGSCEPSSSQEEDFYERAKARVDAGSRIPRTSLKGDRELEERCEAVIDVSRRGAYDNGKAYAPAAVERLIQAALILRHDHNTFWPWDNLDEALEGLGY